MNSKINSIFVCFVISLIIVLNIEHTKADVDLLDNLIYYDDSEIDELSFKDRSNLHHAFVIEESKWDDGQINFKIDKNFDGKTRNILCHIAIQHSTALFHNLFSRRSRQHIGCAVCYRKVKLYSFCRSGSKQWFRLCDDKERLR